MTIAPAPLASGASFFARRAPARLRSSGAIVMWITVRESLDACRHWSGPRPPLSEERVGNPVETAGATRSSPCGSRPESKGVSDDDAAGLALQGIIGQKKWVGLKTRPGEQRLSKVLYLERT